MLTAAKYFHLLSLVIWIGSVIFYSFVATPTIFRSFEKPLSGDIVGALFPKYFMVNEVAIVLAIATLGVMTMKIGMVASIKMALILLVVALGLASYAGFVNGPQARAVKQEIHATSDEAKVVALKKNFGKLHGISMGINLLNLILGLVVLFYALRYLPLKR